MPIPVICKCTAKLRIADHLRGQLIQCPKCAVVHPVDRSPDEILAESGFSDAERARLEEELEAGEALLWAGKPRTSSPYIQAWMMSSGFFFTAIVIGVILLIVYLTHKPPIFILLGLGGVAGLLILGGIVVPFLVRGRWAKTAYALTSRRALAWDGGLLFGSRFHEYVAADLARFHRAKDAFQGSKGIGSLIFATEVRRKDGQLVRRHGFFYIAKSEALEKLLRERLVDPYTDKLYE